MGEIREEACHLVTFFQGMGFIQAGALQDVGEAADQLGLPLFCHVGENGGSGFPGSGRFLVSQIQESGIRHLTLEFIQRLLQLPDLAAVVQNAKKRCGQPRRAKDGADDKGIIFQHVILLLLS